MKSLTFSAVKAQLKNVGVRIRFSYGQEYRVIVAGTTEQEAYYTPDLKDALQTGLKMAEAGRQYQLTHVDVLNAAIRRASETR